ncbi:type I-E CRISPR-associated protein Cse1/CasA [Streptomyces sp. NPDC088747]|uniref:type I-E CRISPR-associated protein Cse1/CasA n=1 Tax=Streptomyces sp. NPDC088747 TaxID=3365886 RepID=UPI0037F123CB
MAFDLTSRPWIGVLRRDGRQDELSLRAVFEQAHELRRIVGDLPSQEFALLRLLLAVAHDALDGPQDIEQWADLWADDACFDAVGPYLDRHRDRFDLLHPQAPFYQVAGLRTAKDEVSSLNRIVADVPNGDPFFSSRLPGVSRLGFAEAARWVVHAHAYDTSGIKSGAVGDDRAKGGKVYPLGVGWAGALGGVFAEGDSLRETLLLNLVAADTDGLRFGREDRPAWRREPCTAAAAGGRRPAGLRDLYTWQSRRVRLHVDAEQVTGVVLGYGDPLAAYNMHTHEPMSVWRRSPAQEKKQGKPLIYLPREHDPARSAWRGLASLIVDRVQSGRGADAAPFLRPGVLEWIARLVTEGGLPRGFLIRARVVGSVYGTQQSVIDEIVDDHVAMGVVLLHRSDREHAQQAIDAVAEAEAAVIALGDLATDLARSAGADGDGPRAAAREAGFAALDGPYRAWLTALSGADDPYARRAVWQRDVYRRLITLGDRLQASAGDPAWQGRVVPSRTGSVWLNSALADRWFRSRLSKALSHPFAQDRPPADAGPDCDPDSSSRVPA